MKVFFNVFINEPNDEILRISSVKVLKTIDKDIIFKEILNLMSILQIQNWNIDWTETYNTIEDNLVKIYKVGQIEGINKTFVIMCHSICNHT